MEVHLYLPQMRLSPAAIVARAVAAERAGFHGVALMDHLAPPLAEDQPMFEAMTLAAWLAAHTERVVLSHLVLCDGFRHPAQLAREAATLDHVAGGRFELGLGSGSVPAELGRFGIPTGDAKARLARLAETLEVLRLLWSGESVDHLGPTVRLTAARQLPVPVNGRIPLVLGGTSPGMLRLVRQHADWWNVPPGDLHRLEELRTSVGDRPRVSALEMYALVPPGDGGAAESLARRRYGHLGAALVVGEAEQLRDHLRRLADRGVDRVYAWFADFAEPSTLERFGAEVISG